MSRCHCAHLKEGMGATGKAAVASPATEVPAAVESGEAPRAQEEEWVCLLANRSTISTQRGRPLTSTQSCSLALSVDMASPLGGHTSPHVWD